ncbi:vegetative incompatibility protein HET-E-1 [Rostrohypoxylon terebratum]|nr:vegetative incompatibility protein HET-E-1 [Rostrohypoxylon terebratum]
MRLLYRNEDGTFQLTKDLAGEELPSYAILSHTWLLDGDEEVTYDDLVRGNTKSKPAGYAKIEFCGEQATKDGLEYFWLDTCCINRNSSAELQEAITTMFTWYRNATRCYAYLTDVSANGAPSRVIDDEYPLLSWEPAFRRSRWFTRGWTLQELLAPASVEFFSVEGIRLGDKKSLQSIIHEITGIPHEALRGEAVANFTVDQRLSWAANRQTKRKEDKAYCLLGIFNIFMPLLYGEGDHAFDRLRQEIDKKNAENAKRDHLLALLPVASEAAFNSRHNQHEPTCLPNTRTELLHEIEKWIETPNERCIFWLNGIAGTGKSTVARTVARTHYNRGDLGANFFFSRGGGDLSNANKLVTTLSRQLAARLPPVRRYICEAIDEQEDIMSLSLKDQWEKLIINPLSKLHSKYLESTVVIVIDALDECESERDVRVLIRVLSTSRLLNNVRLRVFVTSRPDILIRHGFTKIPEVEREVFALHQISPDIIDRDISIFFENHLLAIREERGFEDDWPGTRIIKRLVEISCGLFIWASTACRFIREGRRLAKRRIKILINGYSSGVGPEKQLDLIYTNVLRNAIQQDYNEKEKQELCIMFRDVLGSIVILCSPLSMESLAELLTIPLGDIKDTLADLHTIFNIPPKTSYPLRLHHPTFRDFLLDKERCRDLDFWIDQKQAHKALVDNCLALMSKKLKSDICGLGSPGTLIENVEPSLIERCIPPDLQYACLYWVEHCRQSGMRLADGDTVERFFREHFLHWLEAINLMGKSAEMGAIIRLYHAILAPDINRRQIPFVKDARRFIFKFQNIIKRAPLQTYCAALSFVPSSNELKRQFQSQIHPWIKSIQTAEADVPEAKDEFNYVSDLAFTPDSKKIVSGSNFETVRSWDVATRATLCGYEGATDKMSSVAISPDGMTVAAGSDDFTVMAWDLETKKMHYSIKAHSGWVNSVAFSPNGKILASGAMDETVALWDALTGEEIRRIDNQSSCVNTLAFSPDGSLIATGSIDQMIRLWDVSNEIEDLRTILDGHSGCINSVRFSPNGKRIVSGSDDMTIKLWDTTTGTEQMTLKGHVKKVMAVGFSLDARLIASGSEDKTVRIWNADNGTAVAILRDHTSGLNSVVFSPDSKLLASSSFDDEIRLWDTQTWTLVGKLDDFADINPGMLPGHQHPTPFKGDIKESSELLKGHSSTVTRIVISPDGQWLASGSQDATIKIWLRRKIHRKLEGHSDRINDLAFSPDGSSIASASADKTLRLWNTSAGVTSHILRGHSDSVLLVLFSPDGQQIASCSNDGTVRLWNLSSGELTGIIDGHSGPVNDIAFSPDNRFIASCSADLTVLLSSTKANAAPVMLRGHSSSVNSVAFSSDSNQLISCSDDCTIRFWNKSGAGSGIIRDTLPVDSASFSTDGQLMAYSTGETIKLWDLSTKSTVSSLDAGSVVRKLSFSISGRHLKTNRGILDVGSFRSASSSPSTPSSTRPYALFVTNDWLRRETNNVVWLPNEYHATDVATWDNLVVMGHSTGAISFIEFSI